MNYIVEEKAPIIRSSIKVGRPKAYPFDQMNEIGMSFFVPASDCKYGTIYIAVARENKRCKGKKHFKITMGEKNDITGFRVQRVA